MSMKMDTHSNGRESLTTPYRIAAKPRNFANAGLLAYRLKNLSAAARLARFCVMSASSRAISSRMSWTRAASSSTENRLRSCPISCATFFFGLSSSGWGYGYEQASGDLSLGFRVASIAVPEPSTLLIAIGLIALNRRRHTTLFARA